MSLPQFSGLASSVIGMFSITVPVREVTYANVGGEDKQTLLPARTIEAAVDASSRRQLEQIFGQGAVSDGDIGIYTLDVLYFADSGERKQSFVTYNGTNYKVVADNDWTDQADCIVYLARRHVIQDLL